MKRCLMMLCVAILVAGRAGAQQKKNTAPPKTADSGPSLEVTMKFIQDKVTEQGTLNYATHPHDSLTGADWMYQTRDDISGLVADPARCRISFHEHMVSNNSNPLDFDISINLKDVNEESVMTLEQDLDEGFVNMGRPAVNVKVNPAIWMLRVSHKGENHEFGFHDEQVANRVAKALVHAVELCGGGSPPEPF